MTEQHEESNGTGRSKSDDNDDPTLQKWSEMEEQNEKQSFRDDFSRLKMAPQRTCLHHLFDLITFFMVMAALLMMSGQIAGLYYYEIDPLSGVTRCYVVLMCFIILLNELEWTQFIRDSAILRLWITRGMFYSFVGVLGLEENESTATEHAGTPGYQQAMNFIMVVAYIMVGFGCLYFGMGMLCLQVLRNRVVADYIQRCSDAKAVQKFANEGSIA